MFRCPGPSGTPEKGPCPYWDFCNYRLLRTEASIHQRCQHRRVLTVTTSPHGMRCVQAHDLSLEECHSIKGTVTCQYMPSPDYQKAQAAGAFLQGYEEPNHEDDGWVLVEFWSQNEQAIQDFVTHLNSRLTTRT